MGGWVEGRVVGWVEGALEDEWVVGWGSVRG